MYRQILEDIKDKGDKFYLIISPLIADEVVSPLIEALNKNKYQVGLACLWRKKSVLEAINKTIYPSFRKYKEPLMGEANIVIIGLEGPIDSILNEMNLDKDSKVSRYLEDEETYTQKTPELIKKRREKILNNY